MGQHVPVAEPDLEDPKVLCLLNVEVYRIQRPKIEYVENREVVYWLEHGALGGPHLLRIGVCGANYWRAYTRTQVATLNYSCLPAP